MIAHVFRLVWNRRRHNALILVEILVSFLILCGLFTVGATLLLRWNEPLGFDYRDVWSIGIGVGPFHNFDDEQKLECQRTLAEIERTLGDHPDAIAAGLTSNVPYSGSRMSTSTYVDGKPEAVRLTWVRVPSRDVLGFEIVEGRWFEEGDAALDGQPVVITQDLARGHFGLESALGRVLPSYDEAGQVEEPEEDEIYRVIGVVRPIRGRGEHEPAELSMFRLFDIETPEKWVPPTTLLVKTRPGTPVETEEALLDTAHRLAPEWQFTFNRLEDMRADTIRRTFLPLLVMGVVAGFLIIMVGLGLIGVLWQAVVWRRQEIGLRRALGGTGRGVRTQILGELLALATLAMVIGIVIYAQVPVLGLTSAGWPAILVAIGLSLALMYGFVVVCGIYPSWLATRVQPAEALNHE